MFGRDESANRSQLIMKHRAQTRLLQQVVSALNNVTQRFISYFIGHVDDTSSRRGRLTAPLASTGAGPGAVAGGWLAAVVTETLGGALTTGSATTRFKAEGCDGVTVIGMCELEALVVMMAVSVA